MAGGRKNKTGSSSSSRGSHHNNNSNHQQKISLPTKPKAIDDQLYQCMEVEVVSSERSSSVSWKECTLFLLITVAMAVTCLLTGIAAGVTISVQYYEEKNTVAAHRITTMDTDINDIQRRITIRVDDEEVVQELPPLNSVVNETSKLNHTQGITISEPIIRPTLCSDGVTMGFQDWNTLKSAIHEANRLSAERFMKWNQFLSDRDDNVQLDDVALYYEQDVFFTICPDTTLRGRRGPIFINAENIVLECDGCIIDVGGSHLNFGPHAKNVLIRGITFRGAQTSSLTFYHDGSDAAFEDCYWYENAGNGKSGAVADVNSTRYAF